MSRRGRKRSLDDTQESRKAGVCVLHFKESTNEHLNFIFIAEVKPRRLMDKAVYKDCPGLKNVVG